jgi:hypothetical protein
MLSNLKSRIDKEKQKLDETFGDLCAAEIRNDTNDTHFEKCCTCAEKLQFLLKEFEYQICRKQNT